MAHVMFSAIRVIAFVLATSILLAAQNSNPARQIAKPGVKQVQVPFAELRPSVTFTIGKHLGGRALPEAATSLKFLGL